LKTIILNAKGAIAAFPNLTGTQLEALLSRLESWEK